MAQTIASIRFGISCRKSLAACCPGVSTCRSLRWRARRALAKAAEPVIYALCWFAAIFIFFSLSRGKCQVYILPAFPPLALLIGWVIAEV